MIYNMSRNPSYGPDSNQSSICIRLNLAIDSNHLGIDLICMQMQ